MGTWGLARLQAVMSPISLATVVPASAPALPP